MDNTNACWLDEVLLTVLIIDNLYVAQTRQITRHASSSVMTWLTR